ncbi:MAG: SRPBCC domain-containing protein [Elusimicrobiota bacterium]|jgi:uncharacterized protein YndB with AHSA1/START domain
MSADKGKPSSVPVRGQHLTRDLRLSARIKAKPAQVYHALTSARELCRWWLSGAETDARDGGRLRMVWPGKRGDRGVFGEREGCFVDLEPDRKVAWMWRCSAAKGRVPPLCSIFILPQGRGCEVTILHAGFSVRPAGQRAFAGFSQGWEDALAKLKLYLETGRTCKSDVLTLARPRARR